MTSKWARAAVCARTSLGVPASSASAAAPAGRFRKKIQRQFTAAVISPPATGPAVAAVEPAAVHSVIARLRLTGSGKACRTSASEAGSISAAAAPCTSRAVISSPSDGASPHAAEESVNPISPRP